MLELQNKSMKIIVYATNKNGDGFAEKIGEYDSLEEFRIRISHFADDVVISFEIIRP